jgi:bifunctional hydroxylase/dehydrase
MEYPDVGRHLAGMVSGLDIRYDVGAGDHPLLGRRIPNEELVTADGKTCTVDLLHQGRGVLLDLADRQDLRHAAVPWSDRIRIVTAHPHQLAADSPLAGTAALLVRPDGYVAWTDPAGDALATALNRWFGSPLELPGLDEPDRS